MKDSEKGKLKVSIGFIADSHVGYHQYGSPTRRRDFAFGLHNAVKAMVAAGVKVIIHAGDLFNSSRPSSEDIRELQELHSYLISHKMPFLVVSGNHDYAEPSWIEVLEPSASGGVRLIDEGKTNVFGIVIKGYPSSSRKQLTERFEQDDLSDVDILVLHAMVKDFVGYPTATAISMDEIPNIFQVVAIGDLHIHDLRTRMNQNGKTGLYGYPGSTELCSITEDPVKRWVELKFEDGVLADWQAHVFATRPVIKLTINDADSLETSLAILANEVTEVKAGHSPVPILYVDFKTNVENVMDRVNQAVAGIDVLIVPQPRYEPAKVAGMAQLQKIDLERELSIQDILNMQMKPSEALYDVAMQLINPDVDSKQALTSFVEARLKPKVVADA